MTQQGAGPTPKIKGPQKIYSRDALKDQNEPERGHQKGRPTIVAVQNIRN
jgi:hypothetical protein